MRYGALKALLFKGLLVAVSLLGSGAGAQSTLDRVLNQPDSLLDAVVGIHLNVANNIGPSAPDSVDMAAGVIDGRIINRLRQRSAVEAEISSLAAVADAVTIDIGTITNPSLGVVRTATTGIGAVNTGRIETGGDTAAGSVFPDHSRFQDTRVSLARLRSRAIDNIGGAIVTGNASLNTMDIMASIVNDGQGLNATIGRSGLSAITGDLASLGLGGVTPEAVSALDTVVGGLSSTAIGAINTAEITATASARVVNALATTLPVNSIVTSP